MGRGIVQRIRNRITLGKAEGRISDLHSGETVVRETRTLRSAASCRPMFACAGRKLSVEAEGDAFVEGFAEASGRTLEDASAQLRIEGERALIAAERPDGNALEAGAARIALGRAEQAR